MSRTDRQDFEYPPGLGAFQVRGGCERDQGSVYHHASSLGSYGSQDRRQSSGIQSHSSYGGFAPRSMEQREYGFGVADFPSGPNSHNPSASNTHLPLQSFSPFNHHLHRPSPPSPPPSHLPQAALYQTGSPNDRDAQYYRQSPNPLLASNPNPSRSTLWWGDIEPWMDEEYAKQVCSLMGWDPVNIKVPHPAPDPATGQQANNPGYCFLTFPTPAHAASVLAQVNNGPKGNAVTMPNSSKPFVLNWATSVTSASSSSPMPTTAFVPGSGMYAASAQQQYPKEYSIFVGDLAPETSNSDLVAVFRNPVLGLRNDREPKFIRPFLSCKSAKIMLDPVTGVSRGYGFVRFTDEGDQQRALIEMHGLYCLSRPMRISPATAKFKPPANLPLVVDLPQVQFSPPSVGGLEPQNQPITIALPLPNSTQTKSVSAPIASGSSNGSLVGTGVAGSISGSSIGGSTSSNSLSTGTGSSLSISTSGYGSTGSDEMMSLPNNVLAQIAQQYANGDNSPIKTSNASSSYAHEQQLRQVLNLAQTEDGPPRFTISEESWKHHAQARAILGNLIGPNGEQLTSTDPYNTTVFVGGLSPLISEDTLRTFFAPFGDIHYVKVPVGKHCGFVQFVRKADAEKAIEKMQGFPIGGSRIRLSWGRSQYKAAQAAAQAAQAAALQSQYAVSAPPALPNAMTQEQAIQLLQKFTMQQGYLGNTNSSPSDGSDASTGYLNSLHSEILADQKARGSLGIPTDELPPGLDSFSSGFMPRPEVHRALSTFSPFSPDPNLYAESKRRDSTSRLETLPHPSKAYAPGFFSLQTQDMKIGNGGSGAGLDRVSPTSTRPSSASRYGSFAENTDPPAPLNRAPGRAEAPISRPASGQTSSQGQADREQLDFDPLRDLNGTLASLDLDRPWKSSEHMGHSPSNGQFHLARRTPSP